VTDINPSRGWTGFGAIDAARSEHLVEGAGDRHLAESSHPAGTLKLDPDWIRRVEVLWARYLGLRGLIGHTGILPGFQNFMGYRPDKDATIIVLANLTKAPDGAEPADVLLNIFREHIK
jgi:hypothetical protein